MEHCLFYGADCVLVRPKKTPRSLEKAYVCRIVDRRGNIPSKETVINHAQQRGDEWERDVAFRTQGTGSDLHVLLRQGIMWTVRQNFSAILLHPVM